MVFIIAELLHDFPPKWSCDRRKRRSDRCDRSVRSVTRGKARRTPRKGVKSYNMWRRSETSTDVPNAFGGRRYVVASLELENSLTLKLQHVRPHAQHPRRPKRVWRTSICRGEPWRGGREAVTWRREERIEWHRYVDPLPDLHELTVPRRCRHFHRCQ